MSKLTRFVKSLMTEVDGSRHVQRSIERKIREALEPTHLEVINESNKHAVPKDSETHFKVIVVSDQFEKMPLIARHRMINDLLAHELENGVHALSLQTKTVSQWEDIGGKVPATPPCQFKK